MEKNLLLILNPTAGKGQIRGHLLEVVDILTKAGYTVTVHPTQCAGDAGKTAAEHGADYETVVCSGGDGTLNETVGGLMRITEDKRPLLGYLPAGTTNDFSVSLGLSKDMPKAAHDIAQARVFPCDIGDFNGRNFVYVAAFGLFTDVPYITPQPAKNLLGSMAYFLEGIKQLSSIRDYTLTFSYNGKILTGDYLFGAVTNTVSMGGMRSFDAREVRLDDGLFEVLLVKKPQSFLELQSLVAALLRQELDNPLITFFKAEKLEISAPTTPPWTLDGEEGGAPEEITVLNRSRAIRFLVPSPSENS